MTKNKHPKFEIKKKRLKNSKSKHAWLTDNAPALWFNDSNLKHIHKYKLAYI
jgi:hypothetical protein